MSYTPSLALSRHNTDREPRKYLLSRAPTATALPSDTTPLASAPSSAPAPLTLASASTSTPTPLMPIPQSPASLARYQRFVLTDPIAARYLENDASATVLARRQRIEGYEIYLVEQWACSRAHPTFLITTYTGNPDDVIFASIISVPADEAEWSDPMRLYFKSLTEYHARKKDSAYGTLMVTNLGSFPSSLTVIPVPGGDLKKYRELFVVNENLKRLGCSGRVGIKLVPPSGATQAKFHQLYRTSEKIPFNGSVIELVKLCQVALVLFGKLEPEYVDGLLCDVTEKAINDWWIEFGADHYTVEPHDGILGPTTVAALLGMLIGARNRLSAYNAPVAKDVFDIEHTKRGIAYFQKTQKMPRTRRLDRQTLEKLRKVTAKAASKEGWAVPRAFKSTVAELGGKGGEMVMGMVGAGEREGIAEVETVDMDRFVELIRGDHAKWLWHGKPRKSTATDMFSRLPGGGGGGGGGDEHNGSADEKDHGKLQLKRETTLDQQKLTKRETTTDDSKKNDVVVVSDTLDGDKEKDPYSKRAAIKAKLESGSGFHRIKDAVGLRSHQSKSSRDDSARHGLHRMKSTLKPSQSVDASGPCTSSDHDERILDHQMSDLSSITSPQHTNNDADPSFAKILTRSPRNSTSSLAVDKIQISTDNDQDATAHRPLSVAGSDVSTGPPTAEDSVAGSVYHGIDLNDKLPTSETHKVPPLLRRTLSVDQTDTYWASPRNDDWWPRHLSFSIAEESVLRWTGIAPDADEEVIDTTDTPALALAANLATKNLQSEQLKRLHHRLALLSAMDTRSVESRVTEIKELEFSVDADIETLDSIYYPRLDTYHALREDTHAIVSSNRSRLMMSLRELGNMGDKLEYEVSALRGKVEDVEDALGEFERQVEFVEGRADELERVFGQRQGWFSWAVRLMTGIRKPPVG